VYSWSHPTALHVTRTLPADRRIYFVSDLHLGDGTRSDTFMGKDRDLIALLDRVRKEQAHLVIAGDALDFQQAWSMSRVLRAHARLIGELTQLADTNGVTYIWGNHDYDISLFKDLLRFDVCSSLRVGDRILVEHGYQYDRHLGADLSAAHVGTLAHHFMERITGHWLRLPLEHFYNPANRLSFWLFHKAAIWVDFMDRVWTSVGRPDVMAEKKRAIHYWTRNQLGDAAMLFDGVCRFLPTAPLDALVCGHSHIPGRIQMGNGKVYVNTGSWTFASAQYAVWDGEDFTVRDWISGKVYEDELYLPLLRGESDGQTVIHWWAENYLGWLRYRCGEEGALPPLPAPLVPRSATK